jgi:hypothetical protein
MSEAISMLDPKLDDAHVVHACMAFGKTCSEIDARLGHEVGWAANVISWWWALPEADGGMPEFNPYEAYGKLC